MVDNSTTQMVLSTKNSSKDQKNKQEIVKKKSLLIIGLIGFTTKTDDFLQKILIDTDDDLLHLTKKGF